MTDVFRKNSGTLTECQKNRVRQIKEKAEELLKIFQDHYLEGDEFEIDLKCLVMARTELEAAVMWAVKGFTKTN